MILALMCMGNSFHCLLTTVMMPGHSLCTNTLLYRLLISGSRLANSAKLISDVLSSWLLMAITTCCRLTGTGVGDMVGDMVGTTVRVGAGVSVIVGVPPGVGDGVRVMTGTVSSSTVRMRAHTASARAETATPSVSISPDRMIYHCVGKYLDVLHGGPKKKFSLPRYIGMPSFKGCPSGYMRNPISHRCIRRNGETASIPVVRARLSGRTFSGNKSTEYRGFPMATGSKRQVMNRTAHHSLGGQTRSAYVVNPSGRTVLRSRRKAALTNRAFMDQRAAPFGSSRAGRRRSTRSTSALRRLLF